ncbi:hypothetical protein Agub_g6649, partial [Astrephomene gubernaculifera]
MNYSQLLSDCWAYGASYLPICGLPTWPSALLPGLLGGGEIINMGQRRFRVLRKLGEGGYAVVYLVSELPSQLHPHPDSQPRAIKKVLLQSGEHYEAVQREMLVHTAVQHHPHILPLLDYCCSEGGAAAGGGGGGGGGGGAAHAAHTPHAPPAVAVDSSCSRSETTVLMVRDGGGSNMHPSSATMPQLPGGSGVACFLSPAFPYGTLAGELGRLAGRGERLGSGEVLRVLLQLTKAVRHMHALGYVHRDIKPLNVLLSVIDNADAGSQAAMQRRGQQQQQQQQPQRQRQQQQKQRGGPVRPGAEEEEDLEAGVGLKQAAAEGAAAGCRYHCVLMDFGSARSRWAEVATRGQARQLQ